MTKQKRIEFNCTDFSAVPESGKPFDGAHIALTAFLRINDAEDLLCELAADIGFKRVLELLETELREALDTRSDAEQRWADHVEAEREDRRIRR